jgi:molybdopterin/thiamine biosynthesis adenylyltransferase
MTETCEFQYEEAFRINSGVLSKSEQEKLHRAKVIIVGTGGAGGAIAIMLARSGVANFTLVDFDTYSLSNLNRQIGCFLDTIGKYKSEVIKSEILRINPGANINAITRKLSMEEMDTMLDENDVYFSEADDLAYSNCSLVMAQKKRKLAICYMPSGLTGYVMVFPPDLAKVVDPTHLFGGPKGLPYEQQFEFQHNPVYRKGRRWHITQGKMRIGWFREWCEGKATLTQLCPSVWLGASLASMEAIKYITGKWKTVRVPKMWEIDLANNRVVAKRFRRRTWLFSKYIYWACGIKYLNIGQRIRQFTLKSLEKDLSKMEQEESEGKNATLPFLWRHFI